MGPRKQSGVRPLSGGADPNDEPNGLILVVDDDGAVRNALQRLLRSHGYAVLVASDGEQAVEICEALDGDLALVVMDWDMPVMDGSTAFRMLRRRYPGLAVLFMSGSSHHEIAPLLAQGARGFVAKPFRDGTMIDAVDQALRSVA